MLPLGVKGHQSLTSSNRISGRPGIGLPPADASWKSIAETLGCGGEATTQQFDCMKAVPGRKLQDTVIASGLSFNFVFDSKIAFNHSRIYTYNRMADVTIYSDTIARAAAGKFLKVPLMVGSTAEEADIYTYPTHVKNYGGVVPGVFQMQADVATLVRTLIVFQVFMLTQFQLGFTCSAGVTAQHRLRAGVPTWRYLYQGL